MKNIHAKIILLFSLLLLTTSCHDLLEEKEGLLSEDTTDYTNTDNMIQPLYAVYAKFTQRGWEDIPLYGVRGDDVNAGGEGDQQGFANTDKYEYDKFYWMYNQVWENFYTDIVSINNSIEQIEKYMEFAKNDNEIAKGKQYISEAKVIRGFMHLYLTQLWKDIFIIQSSQPAKELAKGTTAHEEVLKFISKEMDEASKFLPDERPNQRDDIYGGVTKYTALAIKALAEQSLGNYQEVANTTSKIINSGKFSLYPDYYQLFKKPGELSNESLLEIQYSDYNQAVGASTNYLNAFFGPSNWTPKVSNIEGGWGFYEPSIKFIQFMLDRKDKIRLQTSVLFTPRGIQHLKSNGNSNLPNWVSNTTPSGDVINDFPRAEFLSGKNYLPSEQIFPGRTQYASGKNMIVIRYGEILLMYAEALTRGATASSISADQAVNLVRTRANMPPLTGVTTDQVLDEKFAELAIEWGIRYYDMVRVKDYNALSYGGRTFTADKVYLPYPQKQVDEIKTLQNRN